VNARSNRMCTALLNRDLTHSSFRLYVALAMALDERTEDVTTGISVEALKALVPGVRGKPLGEGALREGLRDLQREGLIEVIGPQWSKISLQVRLLEPRIERDPPAERLKSVLLNLPGWIRVSR
jgi:hypothetical protein